MKIDDITEISIDYELFDEMKKKCGSQKWFTTSYNHGWKPWRDGKRILVDRRYTLNFCFQQTSIEEKDGTVKDFYKIFRGGRPTTKYGENSSPEDKKRLKKETPTFESMINHFIIRRQKIRNIKNGMRVNKKGKDIENFLSGTDAISMKSVDQNETSMKFNSFHEAKSWAKEHPGRIIKKCPDGDGYIIKPER